MKTTVQRWGNSLALRIPKSFAEEISVGEGDQVDMTIARGRLVIVPRESPEYDINELVSAIRPGNLHEEIVAEGQQGREIW